MGGFFDFSANADETFDAWRDRLTLTRARFIAIAGLCCFATAVLMDVVMIPQPLLGKRLMVYAVVEISLAGALWITFVAWFRRFPELVQIAACLAISIGVTPLMSPELRAPYVPADATAIGIAARLVLLVGLSVLFPVRWRTHALTHSLVIAAFAVGSLLLGETSGRVLAEGFLLVWCAVACTLAVAMSERLSRSEREARLQLSLANDELRELHQMKSDFFANVSHELRTPLTLILGTLRSLRDHDDAAERPRLVDTGLRNASRLLLHVNELLDLAKLDSGRMTLDRRTIDVAALIRRVCANFDSSESGRRLQITGADTPLLAEIDGRQLTKVLYNLFSNAFKFTDPERGKIWVSLRSKPGGFSIDVEDNGVGIPKDQLGRIFDRFAQVPGHKGRGQEGTGIGLALVQEIVTLHGGTVEVHSEVGRGTTFTLTLALGTPTAEPTPLDEDAALVDQLHHDARSQTPLAAVSTVAPPDAPRVLVVEDNPDLRDHLRFVLRRAFRVETANDGAEGYEKARALSPDLVITDYMMPVMNGAQLLEKLRADPLLKNLPVLFLTARAGTEARVEGLEGGANDYLAKPFEEVELLARANALIRSSAHERKIAELNRRLTARVEEQSVELVRSGELKSFLPTALVDGVRSGQLSTGHHLARRKLSVVFVDLVGFTKLSESLEPEELSTVLNEYLSEMTAAAAGFGGHVDKFIGDAVMALFGMDAQDDTGAALAAVNAGLAMRERAAALSSRWSKKGLPHELRIRVGINTGYCTVGVFGSAAIKSFTAVGAPVNLAARLQGHAPIDGVVVGPSTYRLVREQVRAEATGPLMLHNVRDPVEAWNVLSLAEDLAPPARNLA